MKRYWIDKSIVGLSWGEAYGFSLSLIVLGSACIYIGIIGGF